VLCARISRRGPTERWLRDCETLDLKPDVRLKILKHNAIALLGLERD